MATPVATRHRTIDIGGIETFYREAGGHWLLETHIDEIAGLAREFLTRVHS